MKKLIKNKKGLFGLENIGNTLVSVISIIPGWVKFLIFLFLIAILGYVVSVIFQSVGIYCNSADQPVQVSGVFTGINLITQVPDPELLGREGLTTEEAGITIISEQVTYCSKQIQSGTIENLETNTITNFTNPTWFYDGTFCTDCNKVSVCSITGDCTRYCEGNVIRKTSAQKNIFQKAICGNIGCEPPEHYYYDQSQNIYACEDETCEGITLGQKWDEVLAGKGAKLIYPTIEQQRNPSSEKFVGITCTELKPKLALFGLDILSLNIMIVLLIIIILVWAIRELT